jgi:hypothetical protein
MPTDASLRAHTQVRFQLLVAENINLHFSGVRVALARRTNGRRGFSVLKEWRARRRDGQDDRNDCEASRGHHDGFWPEQDLEGLDRELGFSGPIEVAFNPHCRLVAVVICRAITVGVSAGSFWSMHKVVRVE